MTEYAVSIAPKARTYLLRLDRPTRERIRERLRQLAVAPLAHSKPLEGSGGLRS